MTEKASNQGNYQVPAPKEFDFRQPSDWPKWIKRYERFRRAAGVHTQTEEDQVGHFIYTMGEEAEDILQSFRLEKDQENCYDMVRDKFENHFVKRKNVIYERARFHKRSQQDGESADDFLNALYGLIQKCEYGSMQDEFLRDRIVIGIRDDNLSEQLQADADTSHWKYASRRYEVKKQQGESDHQLQQW